jgi:predicted nucleotidyltransferase
MKLSEKTIKKLEGKGIIAAYLFGSRAEGTNHSHSDYDIGVVFNSQTLPKIQKSRFEIYGEIHNIIAEDLPTPEFKTALDVSLLQVSSPALGMAAIKNGELLFESDPVQRADFEEETMRRYLDYLPLKREYEEATLRAFR